jgi:hypothetical protein
MNAYLAGESLRSLDDAILGRWEKLNKPEVSRLRGDFGRLTLLIQKRYGLSRREAETELDAWLNEMREQSY